MPPDASNASPLVVEPTLFDGVRLLRQRAHADDRGWFLEAWHGPRFGRQGLSAGFVQDNVVESRRGVLRGLHFQYPRAQLKLVSVLQGEVFDVVVDIRRGSRTFGQWQGWNLSSENHLQLWIEPGYAHGYQVLSPSAVIHYKCNQAYEPADDRTLSWADPAIGIRWPLADPLLSAKDASARVLSAFSDDEIFST